METSYSLHQFIRIQIKNPPKVLESKEDLALKEYTERSESRQNFALNVIQLIKGRNTNTLYNFISKENIKRIANNNNEREDLSKIIKAKMLNNNIDPEKDTHEEIFNSLEKIFQEIKSEEENAKKIDKDPSSTASKNSPSNSADPDRDFSFTELFETGDDEGSDSRGHSIY